MKLLAIAIALSASAPTPAEAADGKLSQAPLQLRPKAGIVALLPLPSPVLKEAPFVNPASEPDLNLVIQPGRTQATSKPGCTKEVSLCYEADTGRIVFKPARQFMPDIPGLQRENISLKRDRIIFRYSF
jgi:hypothetical protein